VGKEEIAFKMTYSEYFEKTNEELKQKYGFDFKAELAGYKSPPLDPDASIKAVKESMERSASKGLRLLREETIEEFMERLKTMTW